MTDNDTSIPKHISMKMLSQRLGVTRQSIHKMRKAGLIPPPTQISRNRIGWAEPVIKDWLANGGVQQ